MPGEVLGNDSHDSIGIKEIRKKGTDELDEVYLEAETPGVRELEGEYGVTVLAGEMFPFMPSTVARLINPPWDAWRKEFRVHSDTKANVFNRFNVGISDDYEYIAECRKEPAIYGDGECYFCDYGTTRNPAPVRRIRDEIRRVTDGLYIGRSYFTNEDCGYNRFLMYFAIERV